MLKRTIALVALLGLHSHARAQSLSETGWTTLYNQATGGSTSSVAIGPDGTIYWAASDGALSDNNRKPIMSRTPVGPNTGRTRVLHNSAIVQGLIVVGQYLYFDSDASNTMQRLVPGQVPVDWVSDFRPGNNGDDDPAGIARVPVGWSGGSIVAAGNLIVADSSNGNGSGNDNSDVVYKIGATGTPTRIGDDPGNDYTLVDVAVSKTRILVADRQGNRILALTSLNSATSPMSAITITGGLGGSPIGIEWDPSPAAGQPEQFIVALAAGTLVRLTAPVAPATSWGRTQIGSGFAFNANATQVLDISGDGVTLVVAAATRVYAFARCALPTATNCNNNADADVCEVLLTGPGRGKADCNDNLVPDACDIASSFSTDCDLNGVPDECASCVAPVELVFAVDTSSSMDDEAAVICQNLNGIISTLQSEGINVHATIYGVGLDANNSFFTKANYACLSDYVGHAVGTAVPGNPPASSTGENQNTLYSGCGGVNATGNQEDWGRAASVLSGSYPWPQDAIRLVVNVSDEGPWCGSNPVNQADGDAATWAGTVGRNNNVIISTILASGYYNSGNVPMEALAVTLANTTGGSVTRELSGPDLVEAMKGIVRDACISANDCDGNGVPDLCQINQGASDCNNNGRLDSCEGITCNLPPQVGSATVYRAVGDNNASYPVASNFNDPEGGPVGQVTINGPIAGGSATTSNGTIVFTPTNKNVGASYSIPFTACDTGSPVGCGNATLTVIYNDPPLLKSVTQMLAFNDVVVTNFSALFQSTNVINGDDPNDIENPDNAILSTKVGASVFGPFGLSANLGNGNSCSATALDTSNVTFTASPSTLSPPNVVCYVQICEEMPAGAAGVCAVTTITTTVVQCLDNTDCSATARCDTGTHQCVPNADAINDTLAASSTSQLSFNRATLLANDTNVAPATFSLPSLTTTAVGRLTYNSSTGAMTYDTPASVIASDTFNYTVCSPLDATACDTAIVTIIVNRRPDAADATLWAAVNDPTATFNATSSFTDPDNHTLASLAITGATGGTAVVSGTNIVFTPTSPASPGTRTVTYSACDSGVPTACDPSTTLTIIYNDPPIISARNATLSWRKSGTFAFADFFVSTALVHGDNPADDTDGIRSTLVGTLAGGPFGNNAAALGTTVAVVTPGLDTSDLIATAGTTSGIQTFYFQVCEELPAASTAVCAVNTITLTITECQIDADCAGASVCEVFSSALANRCVPCLDTIGGAAQDNGCNAIEPICNEAREPNECVACIDDRNPSGPVPDTGCTAARPACDDSAITTATCYECLQDADCSSGQVCDERIRQCVPCIDSRPLSDLPLADDGCVPARPICEPSSGPADPTECVVCQQTVNINDIDPGCSAGAPDCEINQATGVRRCVGCLSDADCSGNLICHQGSCVPCVDTVIYPDTDRGCLVDERICLLPPGTFATEPSNLVGIECVTCRDDAPPAAKDTGCSTTLPVCDAKRQSGEICVECIIDADCPGRICDEPSNRCVPCVNSQPLGGRDEGCPVSDPVCDDRVAVTTHCEECIDNKPSGIDDGCTPAIPACDERPPGNNTCVECTRNSDCRASQVCDLGSHTCISCVDDARFPVVDSGCVRATPVCVEQGSISGGGAVTIRTCAVCDDNMPLDTQIDEGCDASAPICDENVPNARCTQCNDNGDCGGGKVCDKQAGLCVICLDDRLAGTVDTGCNSALPVCDLAGPGIADDHCVACEDDKGPPFVDWGCNTSRRFCDVAAVGGPTCVGCVIDADCGGEQVCRQGSCVDNGTTRAFDDTYVTTEGVTLTVSAPAAGLVGNDLFPTGTTVTVRVDAATAPNPATQGSLTVAANGTFTFVPAAGYAGTVIFTYTLSNAASGATSSATVTIVVNGKPRPVNDLVATPEDTPVTFDPRNNDGDPNGGPLTLSRIVTTTTHGQAVLDGPTITYTPSRDYTGPDSLVYEVCDATQLCATAAVTITVTPVNDRPVAGDDVVSTPEDTGILVVVLANDVDVDSPVLIVRRITQAPSHGIATIQPDDTVLYEPSANFAGRDAFNYEVCDAQGLCDEAVVLVTATPVNDAPVAADDQTTTRSRTPVRIAVLLNDSDVDGDTLHVSRIVAQPSAGVVRIEPDGSLTYTPGPSDGDITFRYEVCDPGGLCDTAQVSVKVGVNNEPPEPVNDRATTNFNQPIAISVLANDRDPDGDALTLQQVGLPASGTAVKNANGTVTYTPSAGFVGVVTFSYTVCDTRGACSSAIVTVTVLPGANRPPIATDDVISTRVNIAVSIDPTLNDFDPDGDPLAVEDVTQAPLHGTATLQPDGSVTYVPATGFIGTDLFEVSVTDGQGGFDRSTVTVVVSQDANLPPIAQDDAYDVPADRESTLDVLANDRDPNGDRIVIVDVVQPQQGRVSIRVVSGVTRLAYAPNAGAHGQDHFTYTISDGRGGEDDALVTLTFPTSNRPPIAIGESVVTPEDTGVLIVVLANDSDPDGDALTVTAISVAPRHGSAVLDEGGGVLYVPNADYVGPDVFTYRVCDSGGACASATVSLRVTPVNDAPRANDDFYSARANMASTFDVTLNDSDPELDQLTVSRIVVQPNRGTAFVNPDGTVTYVARDTGPDTFVYEVCDPDGLCDTALVTVYVGGSNRNPTPRDDEAQTDEAEPVGVDVLANDTDPDGDLLHISQVEDPAHGTARIEGREIVYRPDDDFVGTEVFFYTVCDTKGACGTAFVIVDVTPGDNSPPIAVDDTIQTPQSTPIRFDSTLNDVDFDGDTLTVTSVTQPAHGDVRINPDGTLTYTPSPGYIGDDYFTVTIGDGRGGSSTQNVLVHVTPAANRPPDAKDDFYDAPSDVMTALPVLMNDVDPDGDALQIVDVVQPQHGSVSILPNGQLLLDPDPGYIGPDRFSYTITDGRGGYDTAYVDLVIGDRDHDGLGDGWEVTVTHTDPDDWDTDGDGISDGDEIKGGDPLRYDEGIDTDPLDADTDDDGLSDGTEVRGDSPLKRPTDPLDPDSDHDGVADGVEVGVTQPVPGGFSSGGVPFAGTDLTLWIPDADPSTTTDPLDDDSDDDGLIDGHEDLNGNGRHDGQIGGTGTPGTGETDAANADTDGDGIQDGTELGLTAPDGTGTDLSKFQPDLDPTTTTDPRDTDTDDGGVSDGDEDINHNGYQDPGEIDPNFGGDDRGVNPGFVAEGGGCDGTGGGLLLGLVLPVFLALRRRTRFPGSEEGRDRAR